MEKLHIVTSKSVQLIFAENCIIMHMTSDKGKEYRHKFGKNTPMFKQFFENDINALQLSLTNAPFVFLGDDLIDYRTNEYKGFIHSEDVLNQIAEELGVSETSSFKTKHRRKNGKFILGSKVFSFDFQLDENSNNSFASKLSFPFNPFKQYVECFVGLERLVCLNGMVTSGSVFNYKIPIINNVQENLRVAMRQLSPAIRNDFEQRVNLLRQERASISETLRTRDFVLNRMDSDVQNTQQLGILSQLAYVCDVKTHCQGYAPEIINSAAASFYPSHLKRFDVWNILTELDSHTEETDKSSSVAVQRYANTILFNSATFCQKNERTGILNRTSRFDHDNLRALWGSNGSGF